MPLLHLPVVHKFGIISHSRRLELQERLLQAALQDGKTKEGFQSKKNPFEVTDEFIKKYNSAETATEKAACEAEAQRLLARVRRRTGLRDGGVGPHVNLPFAWTELVFLAHCRGKVHQDSLDTLLISLDQAPVGYYQIPALFYIAETVLYWLQSESPASDALRSAEVKSLKVGQLALLRLFYHHMTGQLGRHAESRSRLAVYLREFPQLEQLYASYPDVAFCHSFIVAAGQVVAGATGDQQEAEAAEAPTVNPGADVSPELRSIVTAGVHELSPVLWHALDVWRCARHLGGDLPAALDGLLACAAAMGQGNWIDSYLALLIVGNAACEDAECLRIFLELGVDREIFVTDKDHYDSQMAAGSEEQQEQPQQQQRRESTGVATDNGASLLSKQSATTTTTTSGTAGTGKTTATTTSVTTTTFPVLSTGTHGNDAGAAATEPAEVAPGSDGGGGGVEIGSHLVGMATWRWELAAGFVHQLARVCIDGATSGVRQRALADPRAASSLTALALRRVDTDDGTDATGSCWRIRYLALQALLVVAKATDGDDLKKCLRDAACPTIEECQRRERVPFVLEGQPIAAVWADLNRLANQTRPGALSGLIGHLAYALTMVYLPALPPPVRLKPSRDQRREQPPTSQQQQQQKQRPARLLTTPAASAGVGGGSGGGGGGGGARQRTTLRQEIALAAANSKPATEFATRRSFDLRRVVEDQWRKQAQGQLELDNATREERLRDATAARSSAGSEQECKN